MISANINRPLRRKVYARDGYRCALCDSPKTIQIHHIVKRSLGGRSHEQNLITLCSDCHAAVHGTILEPYWDVTTEDVQQAIIEYMADYYAPDWNPYQKEMEGV